MERSRDRYETIDVATADATGARVKITMPPRACRPYLTLGPR